jgi:hypothetical protein
MVVGDRIRESQSGMTFIHRVIAVVPETDDVPLMYVTCCFSRNKNRCFFELIKHHNLFFINSGNSQYKVIRSRKKKII